MQNNDFEKLFMDKKPIVCSECKRKLRYKGAGRYMCDYCQIEILDDIYTHKLHCAYLSWEFSKERAETILRYIQERLADTDELELWHIWLGGLIENEKHDFRPRLKASRTREVEDVDWDDWKLHKVHKKEMMFSELNAAILKTFFFDNSLNQRCLLVKK